MAKATAAIDRTDGTRENDASVVGARGACNSGGA